MRSSFRSKRRRSARQAIPGKQQQTATVQRGIEGTIFGAKAGAGGFNTRLGRLVSWSLRIGSEVPGQTSGGGNARSARKRGRRRKSPRLRQDGREAGSLPLMPEV